MHIYIKIGLYMFAFLIVFCLKKWVREKCVFFKVTIMVIFTTVLREFTLITLSLPDLALA